MPALKGGLGSTAPTLSGGLGSGFGGVGSGTLGTSTFGQQSTTGKVRSTIIFVHSFIVISKTGLLV